MQRPYEGLGINGLRQVRLKASKKVRQLKVTGTAKDSPTRLLFLLHPERHRMAWQEGIITDVRICLFSKKRGKEKGFEDHNGNENDTK